MMAFRFVLVLEPIGTVGADVLLLGFVSPMSVLASGSVWYNFFGLW